MRSEPAGRAKARSTSFAFEQGRDQVALLGCLLGAAALAFAFVQARPNRLAQGLFYHLWEMGGPIELAAYLLLLGLALAAALLAARRWAPAAMGSAGSLIIVLTILAAALSASRIVQPGQPYARVSLAPGSWLAILSGYILVHASLKLLSGKRLVRALVSIGALCTLASLGAAGVLDRLSLVQEFAVREQRFLDQLGFHMALSLAATFSAVVIGVPLGVWAARRRGAERSVFAAVNTVQTIPSLALFGLMIAPLSLLSRRVPFLREIGVAGVGWAPALIALTLYALLPIARNTFTSLKVIDSSIIDAGRGMGMGRRQLLARIQFPLALPIILGGIRISLVQAIGNTTVAALIGAGGFGVFIFQGLGQAAPDLILLGTLPVIALAVATDKVMQVAVRFATPAGVRGMHD